MDDRAVQDDPKENQQTKTIGLYPENIAAVERIRAFHKLDSFSQAVRWAIRESVEAIEQRLEDAA